MTKATTRLSPRPKQRLRLVPPSTASERGVDPVGGRATGFQVASTTTIRDLCTHREILGPREFAELATLVRLELAALLDERKPA